MTSSMQTRAQSAREEPPASNTRSRVVADSKKRRPMDDMTAGVETPKRGKRIASPIGVRSGLSIGFRGLLETDALSPGRLNDWNSGRDVYSRSGISAKGKSIIREQGVGEPSPNSSRVRIRAPRESSPNSRTRIRIPGESSSNSRIRTNSVTCAICMEPRSPSKSFGASGCSHLYCVACVKNYLVSQIQEKASRIRCPDPYCNAGTFEPERCQEILSPKLFEKWCSVLCESVVLGPTRFYCPFKDCSAPLMNDGDNGTIRESECPHCWRLFCAKCKVPWHADISCEDFQKLDRNERSNDDVKLLKLAKDKKWQRCSKCKMVVERTEGCKAVHCRCGFLFCYGCGNQMRPDHYCPFCRG